MAKFRTMLLISQYSSISSGVPCTLLTCSVGCRLYSGLTTRGVCLSSESSLVRALWRANVDRFMPRAVSLRRRSVTVSCCFLGLLDVSSRRRISCCAMWYVIRSGQSYVTRRRILPRASSLDARLRWLGRFLSPRVLRPFASHVWLG